MAETISQNNRQVPPTKAIDDDIQQGPSAETIDDDIQQEPSAETTGEDIQQEPSAVRCFSRFFGKFRSKISFKNFVQNFVEKYALNNFVNNCRQIISSKIIIEKSHLIISIKNSVSPKVQKRCFNVVCKNNMNQSGYYSGYYTEESSDSGTWMPSPLRASINSSGP